MPRSKRTMRSFAVGRSQGSPALLITCVDCQRVMPREAIAYVSKKKPGGHLIGYCGECWYRMGVTIEEIKAREKAEAKEKVGMATARAGADLRKRADDLKRELRKPPMKNRVTLERGSKHTKIRDKKSGRLIVTLPDTPSDYRGLRNCIAILKKEKIFRPHQAPAGLSTGYETPSMELVGDGLEALQRLGWVKGQRGRGGGALRRFGEIVQAAGQDMPDMKIHDDPDHYAKIASATLIYGKKVSHENLDLLIAGIDLALKTVPKAKENGKPTDLSKYPPAKELEDAVMTDVEKALTVVEIAADSATTVEAPEIKSEFFTQGEKPVVKPEVQRPNIEDAVFLQVFAACFDNQVLKQDAIRLAIKVAKLEGF